MNEVASLSYAFCVLAATELGLYVWRLKSSNDTKLTEIVI